MTPEKMAEFLAGELIDDIDRLADWLLQMEDRWRKYGQQFQHLLPQSKRDELEAAWKRFSDRTEHLADD